jgi:hypothetical protein
MPTKKQPEDLAAYQHLESDSADLESVAPLGYSRVLGRKLKEFEYIERGRIFRFVRFYDGRMMAFEVDPAGNFKTKGKQ